MVSTQNLTDFTEPEPVVDAIRNTLSELDWHVKETTRSRFVSSSGKQVNESYGCYTKPRAALKGVWVGWVRRRAKIKKAIIDKDVIIPEGMEIGFNPEQDRKRFTVSENGIVVISKGEIL